MPDRDVEAMLRRARSGDERALPQILELYEKRLRQLVLVRIDPRLKSRLDPQDIVQETFLHAVRRFPAYLKSDNAVPVYVWLRQIALQRLATVSRNHLKAGKRTVLREHALVVRIPGGSVRQLLNLIPGSEDTGSGRLRRQELQQQVRTALELLPPLDREILLLRFMEQLSPHELAAVLEVKESTARMRVLRALQRLKDILSDADEGQP